MRYPYSSSPTHYQFGSGLMTPVVKALIGTNVAVFLITSLIPPAFGWLNYLLGLTPELVLTRFMFWQPFTYLFMHGGVGHILINMLIFVDVWSPVGAFVGLTVFLRYYLIAGVGAAVITLASSLLPFSFSVATYTTVTIGASGAIYGLLMAFAMHYPNAPNLDVFPYPRTCQVLCHDPRHYRIYFNATRWRRRTRDTPRGFGR